MSYTASVRSSEMASLKLSSPSLFVIAGAVVSTLVHTTADLTPIPTQPLHHPTVRLILESVQKPSSIHALPGCLDTAHNTVPLVTDIPIPAQPRAKRRINMYVLPEKELSVNTRHQQRSQPASHTGFPRHWHIGKPHVERHARSSRTHGTANELKDYSRQGTVVATFACDTSQHLHRKTRVRKRADGTSRPPEHPRGSRNPKGKPERLQK